jgi:hypothetical protein
MAEQLADSAAPHHQPDREKLRRAAIDVLERNWTGSVTLPSINQYPHQWSWDSAFIAIGAAHHNPARARTELGTLFDAQWADGRLPHIVFSGSDADYFPGADYWASRRVPGAPTVPTSGLIQPPVHARAVLRVAEAEPESEVSRAFLDAAYPRLARWHRYLIDARDIAGSGLASIVHPWESGLDNSPLWDAPLTPLRTPAGALKRRDTQHVNTDERPTDADYHAYLRLVESYRDSGYDDAALAGHAFVMEDPLLNAVLLDAERCLGRIATLLGRDDAPHRRAARRLHEALLARLWDTERRVFTARDVTTDQLSAETTVATFMPLLDPWLPQDITRRLVELAESPAFGDCAYPLPSNALTSDSFDQRRYWRGPTWINTNWLVWLGAHSAGHTALAERIAASGLELVARSGFREYYDPTTGEGLGAERFSWTAALTLDWLAASETSEG